MVDRRPTPVDPSQVVGHTSRYRIYWAETDAGGIVYHARYLDLAERGRTEWLHTLGYGQADMRETLGCVFAVRHAAVDFLRPGQLDDQVDIVTQLTELGRTSLTLAQAIKRGDTVLALVMVVLVCIDDQMRAVRIPDTVRTAVAQEQERLAEAAGRTDG